MKKLLKNSLVIAVVSLQLFVAGCSMRSKRAPIEAVVPGNCTQAIIVPKLEPAIFAADAFINALGGSATSQEIKSLKDSFKNQYSIDPTMVADYEALGLDCQGAMAAFTYDGLVKKANNPGMILVLPVKNEKLFNSQFAVLVGRVQKGTAIRSQKVLGNHAFEQLSVEGRQPLFYVLENGYAYVSVSEGNLGELASFIGNPTNRNLQSLPKYLELQKRVQPKGVFFAFNNDKPPFTDKLAGMVTGALLDFTVSQGRLDLQGQMQMGLATSVAFKQVFAQGKLGTGRADIPADSFIYGFTGGNVGLAKNVVLAKLNSLNLLHDPSGNISAASINQLLAGVLDNLQPPYSLALTLGDVVDVLPKLATGKFLENKNDILLGLLLLSASANVKEYTELAKTIESLRPMAAEKIGLEMVREEYPNGAFYIPQGEAGYGLSLEKNRLLYAVGDNYLKRVISGKWLSTEELTAQLNAHEAGLADKQGAVASLRFTSLAKTLRTLAEGPLKEWLQPARGGQSLPSKLADIFYKLDALTISVTDTEYSDSCAVHLSFTYNTSNAQ